MSKAQKWILAIGLLLIALAALFPPTYQLGSPRSFSRGFLYSGYFNAPKSINIVRLFVEWMFIAAMTAFCVLVAGGRSKNSSAGRHTEDTASDG
jgi:hypothetical protein